MGTFVKTLTIEKGLIQSGTTAQVDLSADVTGTLSGSSIGSHAANHASAGTDPIKLDDLSFPDDNTDLNASTTAHGLLKKLSNVSTEFLNGQGNWATPTTVPSAHGSSHASGGSDPLISGSVTNAMLANRSFASVIGREFGSAGAVQDITATKDGQILRYQDAYVKFAHERQTTITADTSITSHDLVYCNNSSNITVTLPNPTDYGGRRYFIKKIGSNTATVTIGLGMYTIDFPTILRAKGDYVEVISDGSNWVVIDWKRYIGCQAYYNANQTIGNAAWTSFALNSERFDTDGYHDTSTNNDRLTIPTGLGGNYLLQGSVQWASNSTGVRGLRFLANGATSYGLDLRTANNGITTNMTIGVVASLSAGDYVVLQGYQTSGGNLNADYVADYSVWVTATRL